MAVTNDGQAAGRMKLLRSHGISNDPAAMQPRPQGEVWNYQQLSLGFNYRMTDIHAALGLSQIRKLDEFVQSRRDIARRYDDMFDGMQVVRPWQHPACGSSWHLYIVRIDFRASKSVQQRVFEGMHSAGILANLHYIPVYLQPYFERMGFSRGYCPEAEEYFSEAMSLPIYPALTPDEQFKVVSTLKSALAG